MTELEKVIDDLVRDLKPTRPLGRPLHRAIVWSGAIVCIIGGLFLLLGQGEYYLSFISKAGTSAVIRLVALLALSTGALTVTFTQCVPGSKIQRALAVLLSLVAVVLLVIMLIAFEGKSGATMHPHCLELVILATSATTIGITYGCSRGFVTEPWLGTIAVVFSSAALATFVSEPLCFLSFRHTLFMHFPIAIVVGAVLASGVHWCFRRQLRGVYSR
jgi:hypothetical protein